MIRRLSRLLRLYLLNRRLKKRQKTLVVNWMRAPENYLKHCLGNRVELGRSVVFCGADTGYVDNDTYIAGGVIYNRVYIGRFCSIAHGVCLGPGEHYTNRLSSYPVRIRMLKDANADDLQEQRETHIGNDVWIGNNVTVLQGRTVGDGAVLAAGCLVTHDVPPYAIMVGSPARVLRYRFSAELIERLLHMQWWNQDINWIREHRNLFALSGEALEQELTRMGY